MSAWAEREGRIAQATMTLGYVRSGLDSLALMLDASDHIPAGFQIAELIKAMADRMDAPMTVLAEDET